MKEHHEESHTAKIHATLLKPNATSCMKISQKLPLKSVLTQMNPVRLFTPCIPEINFNIEAQDIACFHHPVCATCHIHLNLQLIT